MKTTRLFVRLYKHYLAVNSGWRINLKSHFAFTSMSRNNENPPENNGNETISLKDLNPAIFNVHYAVRGPIVLRAAEIQKEIEAGVSKSFRKVIRANIGDCHAVGQKQVSFYRQVLSACVYPDLLKLSVFPMDINERAKSILSAMRGSVGCYTESTGCEYVRKSVAKYIERRDGYESNPNNIVLTNGASAAVKTILYSIIKKHDNGKTSGILVPIPQYPLYSATIAEYNGELISYYLDEDKNWSLEISECERAIREGAQFSHPTAMVVINPGNPTGQVLTYQNMVEIVKFCMRHKLILLADEVYQENIYDEQSKFFSFKKVVRDMGLTEKNLTLVSFHSISKGFYGECGLRGGYMELFGFIPEVKRQLYKLISAQLCSSTCGQIVMEAVVNPPKPNEPSFELFNRERSEILDDLRQKSNILFEELNAIPKITCNKIQGALYAFARLHLTEKVIELAKQSKMLPDEYYCFKLLEETGICVVPGSGFKQRPDTYHFRTTILPPISEIKTVVTRIKEFNERFF